MKRGLKLFCILFFLILGGCQSLGVKPWERDLLAKKDMQIVNEPLEAAFEDHTYFSKEASSGGGGCGCN